MSNIDYSLWPNAGGTLGQIKVQIPDGINTTWPEGDALVGNFVYKDGKLAGFVDTKALTVNDSKSTIIDYDYFDIELPFTEGEITITRGPRSKYFNVRYSVSNDDNVVITLKYKGCKTVDDVKAIDPDYLTNDIVEGVWSEGLADLEQGSNGQYDGGMFYECSQLTSFSSDLSSLTNGSYMFIRCTNLESFSSDLSSLTDGYGMFNECSQLTSFSSDLSNLTIGISMFYNCSNLTSFSSDLSSLTDGYIMFSYCDNLTSFSSDLSKLWNGDNMFHNCSNLTTFSSDISSLTNGLYMFYSCNNLTSFSSDLSSLTNGAYMFDHCSLNTASVQNIADTIKDVNDLENESECSGVWKYINIGIGNDAPNDQEKAAFNKIVSKGWIVYSNGNTYSPTSPAAITTLDENGEETITPIPFYAKPQQTDEKHAKYVDSEGNFFIILGAQYIYGDDLSTYGMFTCEADAAANMRLTKIEKGDN